MMPVWSPYENQHLARDRAILPWALPGWASARSRQNPSHGPRRLAAACGPTLIFALGGRSRDECSSGVEWVAAARPGCIGRGSTPRSRSSFRRRRSQQRESGPDHGQSPRELVIATYLLRRASPRTSPARWNRAYADRLVLVAGLGVANHVFFFCCQHCRCSRVRVKRGGPAKETTSTRP